MTEATATGTTDTGTATTATTGTATATGATGTAATAPAPFYDGFTNPDLKTWATGKNFKDVETLAQSAWHAEKLIGVPPDQVLKLPKAGADFAEYEPVFAKLGRPEKADAYTIKMPEGVTDDSFAKEVKPIFHKAGLTQKQVEIVTDWWNDHVGGKMKTQSEATAAKHAEEVGKLKTEWGSEFDSKSALADRAGAEFGLTKEDYEGLKQALGPAKAMKMLANIGAKVGSDAAFVGGDGSNNGFKGMSAESAQARIAELRRDKGFAARFNHPDVANRDRAEAREEMARLHRIAYP